MPTTPRKARILLKENKAKVVERNPFTIQLLYKTGEAKQSITLGIDSGYNHIGFSAIAEKEELVSGEVHLLQGMKERIKEKAMYRTQRRNHLRHRKPRFDNRKRDEGWLAPSIQHKLNSHFRFIEKLKELLPISKIIVEVANFDIQKIKNPSIEGKEYQEGEQQGFWNLREYILHRDGHKCQNPNCKSKSKEPILQVYHIGYWRKDRSNRPGNLITLCTQCHTSINHKENGFLYGWETKTKTFKAATFMSIVRWRLVNALNCMTTYGYITKSKRIELGFEKTHFNDAFCIAGGINQLKSEPLDIKQTRRNNRSLEKFYDAKYIDTRSGKKVAANTLHSGRRTRNKELSGENLKKYRGEKLSKGRRQIRRQRHFYQPNDLVKYDNNIFTVKGTINKGKYVVLRETGKAAKVELLIPYSFRKGLVVA